MVDNRWHHSILYSNLVLVKYWFMNVSVCLASVISHMILKTINWGEGGFGAITIQQDWVFIFNKTKSWTRGCYATLLVIVQRESVGFQFWLKFGKLHMQIGDDLFAERPQQNRRLCKINVSFWHPQELVNNYYWHIVVFFTTSKDCREQNTSAIYWKSTNNINW